MKKSFLWLVWLTCLLPCHAAAQTMVEEGVVSGTKTADSISDQIAVVNIRAWEYGSTALGTEEAEPAETTVFACKIYPNPSGEKVTFGIQVPNPGDVEIRLTHHKGIILNRLSVYLTDEDNDVFIDLNRLPPGVYIYEVYYMGHRKSGHIVHL